MLGTTSCWFLPKFIPNTCFFNCRRTTTTRVREHSIPGVERNLCASTLMKKAWFGCENLNKVEFSQTKFHFSGYPGRNSYQYIRGKSDFGGFRPEKSDFQKSDFQKSDFNKFVIQKTRFYQVQPGTSDCIRTNLRAQPRFVLKLFLI